MENFDYDIQKAVSLIDDNSPEESRMQFKELIFDWTDKYTESLSNYDESQRSSAVDSIASLWIAYAQFEQRLRQYKKVVEVFENSLNDEVTSKSLKVFLAYADFWKFRKKIANTQKVYLRALCSQFGEEELDKIWSEFFLYMKENGSPKITLDDLFGAVSSQPGYEALPKPSSRLLDKENSSEVPPPKKLKTEHHSSETSEAATSRALSSPLPVTGELEDPPSSCPEPPIPPSDPTEAEAATKAETGVKLPIEDVLAESTTTKIVGYELSVQDFSEVEKGMSAELLLRDFPSRPTLLFRAIGPEELKQTLAIPGVGFTKIDQSLLADIEKFFGLTAPMICEADRSSPDSHVRRVLDIVESMWIGQALQERQFDSWFSVLIESHREGLRSLGAESGSSNQSSSGLDLQRSKQITDVKKFRIRSCLQMDILNATVNNILGRILAEQLNILYAIENFPHGGPGSQSTEAIETGQTQEEFALLKQVVNALLSVRLYTRGTVASRATRLTSKSNSSEGIGNTRLELSGGYSSHDETSKRKFKSKRRKSVDSVGGLQLLTPPRYGAGHSHFRQVGSSSAFGAETPKLEHASITEVRQHTEHTRNTPTIKPESNLAKLAAMLGKKSRPLV